ncbi:MAG: hypothetical protein V7K97_11250 [Nostoc sp.]
MKVYLHKYVVPAYPEYVIGTSAKEDNSPLEEVNISASPLPSP